MPLQLGCNYSPALIYLMGRDAADVDWIKLSRSETVDGDLALAGSVRPVLLHTLPRAGQRPELWQSYDWAAMERRLRVASSPHIALHFDLVTDDWDCPPGARPGGREEVQAMLARLAAGVRTVQEHLSVPVLVENMPYHDPRGGSPERKRISLQPEAFWQVIEQTGAGLLLDASHLRCAAYHLGVDVRAYARAFPLHAVREIHVSGPALVPGKGLRDRHLAMQEEDYALLAWLLGHTEPAIVTLEYGGTGDGFDALERNDPQVLEEQLRRLHGLLD